MGEPDVAAVSRATDAGDLAEEGRPGVDDDHVFDVRAARGAPGQASVGEVFEALCAEGHGSAKLDVPSNDGRLADDDAVPVVDEERNQAATFCAGSAVS